MEENPGERHVCRLQINTSGTWKDMVCFGQSQREQVLAAVAALSREMRHGVKWCIVRDNEREWFCFDTGPESWQPITDQQPAPLDDVLISVSGANDEAPLVFMAYRKTLSSATFYISGTDDQIIRGAYAWKPIDKPAPTSAMQDAAA